MHWQVSFRARRARILTIPHGPETRQAGAAIPVTRAARAGRGGHRRAGEDSCMLAMAPGRIAAPGAFGERLSPRRCVCFRQLRSA
ncbi:MAG TPA: hypothetical protein DCM87_04105 [Planctomycetes bacterium]|nr:hypothetical protein [Planctomycetota bacterium]